MIVKHSFLKGLDKNMTEKALVDTLCGKVEGICDEGVRRFLGIPFAKAKRFGYPQEITHWDGILQADHYGDAPLQELAFYPVDTEQSEDFYIKETLKGVHVTYSENCLNLNIWAPEKAENAPVLIVIYGGGLVTGSTDELCYDGTALAKKGIIVVFLSYRLNIFGFLALKALEERDGRTGNYGYYDQQVGIEWIRHNIAAFGGDINNMTLAGQSAGAASCEAQIKSPLNVGYFKQAIIQSSAGFTTCLKAKDNRKKEYEKWQKVYDKSGCSSLDDFISLPAQKLYQLYKEESAGKFAFCNAIYDENFTGPLKNQPCATKIMVGMTSEDVMPYILYVLSGMLAKRQKKGGTDTYRYYFCRQLPGDSNGAWHSSDLWYFYGALHKCWRPFTKEDYILSDNMTSYAANFMKSGNPNGSGLPFWESFMQSGQFMFFDTEKMGMGKPDSLRLLKELLTGKHIGM